MDACCAADCVPNAPGRGVYGQQLVWTKSAVNAASGAEHTVTVALLARPAGEQSACESVGNSFSLVSVARGGTVIFGRK